MDLAAKEDEEAQAVEDARAAASSSAAAFAASAAGGSASTATSSGAFRRGSRKRKGKRAVQSAQSFQNTNSKAGAEDDEDGEHKLPDDLASRLFSVEDLIALVKTNEFVYGRDLNVVTCADGKTKEVVHEEGAPVTEKSMRAHLRSSTVQFFQPQRYVNALWKHMASLEADFDALWGANVYITPPLTQGLAPHYDDVDVFVLQCAGEKRWFVHDAAEPYQVLAMEYSEDLQRLGKKRMEVVLRPGDLLYLPRGTTHYAKAEGNEHSVHITLSTHQNLTYYNFLESAFSKILDAAASSEVKFRRGLPVGYLGGNGTLGKANCIGPGRKMLSMSSELLHWIADEMANADPNESGSVAEAFHETVDDFAADFMMGRLPPFAQTARENPPVVLRLTDKVRVLDPRYILARIIDPEDDQEGSGDEEDGEEDEEDMEMGGDDEEQTESKTASTEPAVTATTAASNGAAEASETATTAAANGTNAPQQQTEGNAEVGPSAGGENEGEEDDATHTNGNGHNTRDNEDDEEASDGDENADDEEEDDDEEGEDDDEEDEDDEHVLRVYFSHANRREDHMGAPVPLSKDQFLDVPSNSGMQELLGKLFAAYPSSVAVKDLLKDPETALKLSQSLLDRGAVVVQNRASQGSSSSSSTASSSST